MAYVFPDQLAETVMESLNVQEKIMELPCNLHF